MPRRRVVVAGMVVGDPDHGGATSAALQWVHGARQLGHEVLLIDQLPPGRRATPAVCQAARTLAAELELRDHLVVIDDYGVHGMAPGQVAEAVRGCDALLNLCGRLRDRHLLGPAPVSVFVDLDPAFVQIWHELGVDLGIDDHTHVATVGQNVGTPGSQLPTGGRDWLHVMPPVSLQHWPVRVMPAGPPVLTTVANWRSYGTIDWCGHRLGQKAHSMRAFADLPLAAEARLEVALRIHPGDRSDRERLQAGGWHLSDPDLVAADVRSYQRFVTRSSAELGIAKEGYVTTCSGWISERSAAYAATGRPLVLQDTGAAVLRDRGGVLLFSDSSTAVEAIDRVTADLATHAAAARRLAEELFDARRVVADLLEVVGA